MRSTTRPGVDTSDHEVNIKIGVGDLIAAGRVAAGERAAFLASMTDEVERLVLRDNYLQTLALTLAEARGAAHCSTQHARLMRALERRGRLDRAVEFLPDDETIAQRGAAQARADAAGTRGAARLRQERPLRRAAGLRPARSAGAAVRAARPTSREPMRERRAGRADRAPAAARDHRDLRWRTRWSTAWGRASSRTRRREPARDAGSIARAYLIVRDVFGLAAVWHEIEALDNQVPAASADPAVARGRVRSWTKRCAGSCSPAFRSGSRRGPGSSSPACRALAGPGRGTAAGERTPLQRGQACERTSRRARPRSWRMRILALNALSTAMDIVQISEETGRDIAEVARLYFAAGSSLGLLTLRRQARIMPAATEWQHSWSIRSWTTPTPSSAKSSAAWWPRAWTDPATALQAWLAATAGPGSPVQAVLADIARTHDARSRDAHRRQPAHRAAVAIAVR